MHLSFLACAPQFPTVRTSFSWRVYPPVPCRWRKRVAGTSRSCQRSAPSPSLPLPLSPLSLRPPHHPLKSSSQRSLASLTRNHLRGCSGPCRSTRRPAFTSEVQTLEAPQQSSWLTRIPAFTSEVQTLEAPQQVCRSTRILAFISTVQTQWHVWHNVKDLPPRCKMREYAR